MQFNLRVSKVLITGGGSGIGLALAKALLKENCHVCICGRNYGKLLKAKENLESEKLSIMAWDIRDVSLVEEKINEAACLCGGFLDGLVNNAAIYASEYGWHPWNETEATWDAVWSTNLKAQIFLLRKFSTYLHNNNKHGNILCVSSIAGNKVDVNSSYGASKYAFTKMVKGHAKQVLPFGIVINGILPGVVHTPMANYDNFKGAALQRSLKPEEIAACCLFLLSDAATICCGEMLNASGGFYGAN